MPIIQSVAISQIQAPDGTVSVLPPPIALLKDGPRVQVAASLSKTFADAMSQVAGGVPPAVATATGVALIDTGASTTCVDDAVAQSLGLPIVGKAKVSSASHDSTDKDLYPIYLEFLGHGLTFDLLQVPGAPLAALGILALIGRDILERCVLIYNGQWGMFTLAAP